MMARYSKIFHSIWSDPDFRPIASDAKLLYLFLCSQPDLSTAGVISHRPRRWHELLADQSINRITKAVTCLATQERPFVVVDPRTEELWVRSFIKYDELYKVPNGRKSIDKALSEVLSEDIRQRIVTVLATLDGTLPPTPPGTVAPSQLPVTSYLNPTLEPSPSSSSQTPPSSLNGTHLSLVSADDDDEERMFIAQVIDHIVSLRMQRSRPRNPIGYKLTVTADVTNNERPQLVELHQRMKSMTADNLANYYEARPELHTGASA